MKINLTYILILSIFLFSGCSVQNITANGMAVQSVDTAHKFNTTVAVDSHGGRIKDPLGIPEISDPLLIDAVKTSILNTQLFNKVVPDQADYNLELFIVKVGQPVAGLDMTVNVEIAWVIKNNNNGKIIWKKSITTSSTKTTDDASSGINRLVIATQDAAHINIENGLNLISKLDLNK
ncbi:hypothetical protein [Sulfurospirillum arcachonense]|uniref:hypothetical protein n=1 Tax=Sulfurospirillum arcachonense TaxID=57666 RepID=UPI00046AFD2C|nr:hypothetical protein [Sulfurospirillum arcachonense]